MYPDAPSSAIISAAGLQPARFGDDFFEVSAIFALWKFRGQRFDLRAGQKFLSRAQLEMLSAKLPRCEYRAYLEEIVAEARRLESGS